jgi:hypothetical protein
MIMAEKDLAKTLSRSAFELVRRIALMDKLSARHLAGKKMTV